MDILPPGGGGAGGEGKRSSGSITSGMERCGDSGGFREEYNSSSSSSSRVSTGFDDGYDDGNNNVYEYDDDGMLVRTGSTSSRSSISSLPGSVLVHPRDSMAKGHRFYDGMYEDDSVGEEGFSKFIPRVRDKRSSPFRHPSSVRAMQMNDGDDESVIGQSRYGYGRRGHMGTPRVSETSRVSVTSPQSSASNHYRRSPNNQSPAKQNVKKEYPLVLLHCNLLPPSLSLPAGIRVPHPRVLKDVLPPQYWRRWKLLEDKIIASGVLQDRGVLISHPQEAYDLLEERLLESLELVTPRLDNGHFLGGQDEDDDDDDEVEDGSRGSEAGSKHAGCHECPDCGTKVVRDLEGGGRKWEIKVYAANGLMKSGAWSAAWREMEKVDVEVRVWLPEDVRRDIEARVLEDDALELEEELRESEQDRRRREVYGSSINDSQLRFSTDFGGNEYKPTGSTARLDTGFEEEILQYTREEFREPPSPRQEESKSPGYSQRKPAPEIDLQTLIFNYFRVLARDRRNILIGFLGVLVLFLAINMNGGESAITKSDAMVQEIPDIGISPISSVTQCASSVQPSVSQDEIVKPTAKETPTVKVPEPEDTLKGSVPEAHVEAYPASDVEELPAPASPVDDASGLPHVEESPAPAAPLGEASDLPQSELSPQVPAPQVEEPPAPAVPVDEVRDLPQSELGPDIPVPPVEEPPISAVKDDPIAVSSVVESEKEPASTEDEPASEVLDKLQNEDQFMEETPEIEELVLNQEETVHDNQDD